MGQILVISGTNRPGSNTLKIAQAVHAHYRRIGTAAELYDLQQMPAALFHPSSYAEKPAGWKETQDGIVGAAGLHVVTPEYNGSFPGVFKYFIDMLPFPEALEHKPVAFTGLAAGMWGAMRSIEQLQLIFAYRNAYVFPDRVFVPLVRTRIEGDRLIDGEIDKRLATQAAGFVEFVKMRERKT
jgi:chromate reductase, NAD(P)H dehydrogenase (quinone)